jgi:uncharacterized protein YegJ (DUF2314 family)
MRWWQWAVPLALGAGVEIYRQWRKSQRAPVVQVDDDDPEVSGAIAEAQASLPEFVRTLAEPQPGHRGFAVKAFFPDLGEHIWVSDVTHAEGVFSGALGNHPLGRTSLRIGDPVEIPGERVTDWKYIQHDVLVGGYTIRVLRNRMREDERKAMDSQLDFRIL